MAIYVILSQEPNPTIEDRIKNLFPEDYYLLSDRQWLVSSNKIAKSISDEIGISNGEHGNVVVFWITGYFGWWTRTVWEWMRLKEAK